MDWHLASLPVLLLLINLSQPGTSFLFKRNSDADLTSGAHLKRRYWNDDIQPCIERNCLRFVSNRNNYLKCLQIHCPEGLVTVPRDLDAVSLFPIAAMLGDTEFCADDFLGNSPPMIGSFEGPDCSSGHCSLENMVSGNHGGSPLTTFKYGVYNLCRASLCADVQGDAHYDCVRDRCCGRNDQDQHNKRKRAVEELSLKKRVNDDVSQCIQSYCSGKQSNARLFCIVKNCHRN